MDRKIALLAITTIIFFGSGIAEAYSKTPVKKRKTRKELISENDSLRNALDSLTIRLSDLEELTRSNDSITDVIFGHYEEEIGDGLIIRDSTASLDSLLSIYYMQRRLNDYDPNINLDDVEYTSNIPDSVYIRRLEEMNSFITLPYNSVVKNYIIQYTEKMPTAVGKILGLSAYYMPIFEEIFTSYGLPQELKAMAVIESALNPTAVSRASAKGMWQFIYPTARHYGLTINSFVDERLDPIKSTYAAAQYMKDAYEIFGDWALAIASYNCGAGNVNKAIRRSGNSKDFWEIYYYLPRETRGYVPAFVAALYTLKYYKEHNLQPEPIALPPHVDTIHVHKMLHLEQVSALTGIKLQELKDLNPQYVHNIIPGNEAEYILRLPYNYTNAFIDHEKEIYDYQADKYFNSVELKKIKDGGDGERIVYRVKSGDVLGKIAMRYGTTVAKIKRWNGLKSDRIRVNQRLIIYRGGNGPAASSSTASSSGAGTSASGEKITYTVKSGDVLGKIAIRHGVSVASIKKWNGLKSDKISIGQKLTIYTNGGPSASGGGEKTVYTVKNGDVLGDIAIRHGVTVSEIKNWNGLRSDRIRVGQKLTIYTDGVAHSGSENGTVENGYIVYTVQKGDTFWDIAKKFPGTTSKGIMSLNGMDKNSKIYPGMKIRIKKA